MVAPRLISDHTWDAACQARPASWYGPQLRSRSRRFLCRRRLQWHLFWPPFEMMEISTIMCCVFGDVICSLWFWLCMTYILLCKTCTVPWQRCFEVRRERHSLNVGTYKRSCRMLMYGVHVSATWLKQAYYYIERDGQDRGWARFSSYNRRTTWIALASIFLGFCAAEACTWRSLIQSSSSETNLICRQIRTVWTLKASLYKLSSPALGIVY